MQTTGKFDCNGKEIFVGDKVIHAWGSMISKGKEKVNYQIHTINTKKAHLMANGEMHDDGNGLIFCMGNCYNFWKGKEVQKLTNDEVNEIGIEEDTMFFFDDNNKAVRFTDQHFMGLSDEEWEEEKKRRKEFFDGFKS